MATCNLTCISQSRMTLDVALIVEFVALIASVVDMVLLQSILPLYFLKPLSTADPTIRQATANVP